MTDQLGIFNTNLGPETVVAVLRKHERLNLLDLAAYAGMTYAEAEAVVAAMVAEGRLGMEGTYWPRYYLQWASDLEEVRA